MGGVITIGAAGPNTKSNLLMECTWSSVAELVEVLEGLDGALRDQGWKIETGFVGGAFASKSRTAATWISTSVVTVDVDTHDHSPLTEADGDKIGLLYDDASLPGSCFYYTPAGCRIVFALAEPCTDQDLTRRAILGAMTLVEKTLRPLGLGVEADGQTKDVARWNYGPRACAKGVQREEDVYVIGEGRLYAVSELAALAPVKDPRNLEPPLGYIAGLAKDSLKFKIDPEEHEDCTRPLMTRCADAISRLHIYTEEAFVEYIRPWNDHLGAMKFMEADLCTRFRAAFARFEEQHRQTTKRSQVFAPLERGDETTCADRLVYYLRQDAPHVYDLDAIWRYDSEKGAWRAYSEHEERNAVMDYLQGHPTYGRPKEIELSDNKIEGIRRIVRTRLRQDAFFDSAPFGVAVQNGFLATEDGKVVLREHSPENRAKHSLSFTYTPGHKSELWEDFLETTLAGLPDRDTWIRLLRQFVGAAVFGVAPAFKTMLILEGGGDNGKTLFLETVESLFPADTITHVQLELFAEPSYLARLRSSAINVVHELSAKALKSDAAANIKSAISGDSVEARELYARSFSFRPRAAFISSCNELPYVADTTHGWWERVRVVPFPNTFPRNPGYRASVLATAPYVLNWAVEGYMDLLAEGRYVEVTSTTQAEWKRDSNSVEGFVADSTEPCTTGTLGTMLYAAYEKYCDGARRERVQPGKFWRRLRRLGIETRTVQGNNFWLLKPKNNILILRGPG